MPHHGTSGLPETAPGLLSKPNSNLSPDLTAHRQAASNRFPKHLPCKVYALAAASAQKTMSPLFTRLAPVHSFPLRSNITSSERLYSINVSKGMFLSLLS